MNTYLETFNKISQSVEQLLTDDHNSLEIKQSATKFRESVQPCIEELKHSATRLKNLVQGCFDDLHHAEDVWNSKPRIASASKPDIWEQMGQVSGCDVRIHHLGKQLKSQAVEQAKQCWENRAISLRKKWFFDAKSGKPKNVDIWDKEKLIQDICSELDLQAKDLSSIFQKNIELIYQEIKASQLSNTRYYCSLLNRQEASIFFENINAIIEKIGFRFSHHNASICSNTREFIITDNIAVEFFRNQGWLGTNGEQFSKFSSQVYSRLEKIIISVFDDRIELATKATGQVIAFYNYFLERQERYRQETPEQRQAEKAWIDQQRRELMRVQYGIEAILNQSAG
jgi:hypothetical protein